MVLLTYIFSVGVFLVFATAQDVSSTTTDAIPESTTETKNYPSSNATTDYNKFFLIVMGERVQPKEIPWQAYLVQTRSNGDFTCGGSLIQTNWVLTAAHCIVNPGTIVVHLGGTNIHNMPIRLTASAKFVHENYNPDTHHKDVGLLKLPKSVSGLTFRPITLAQNSVGSLDGTLLRLSGFGRTSSTGPSSPDLLKVNLTGISNAKCSRTFRNIINSTLCATYSTQWGQSGCQGDSGGPLTARVVGLDVLVGVASFGATRCDQGKPSAYARVSSFWRWIVNTMYENMVPKLMAINEK